MNRLWFNADAEGEVIDFDKETEELSQEEMLEEESRIQDIIKKAEQDYYTPSKPVPNLRKRLRRPAGYRSKYLKDSKFQRTQSQDENERISSSQRRNRTKLQNYIEQYGPPETPSAQKKLKTIVSVPLCCLWNWGCCKEATFING